MEYPPQPGETWINIHTSQKAHIDSVQDVNGAKGSKVVLYTWSDGNRLESSRCDIQTFQAHWKRNKSASKWFLGALGG